MGWNIELTTDKPMTEAVIDEVIADLPEGLRRGSGKQPWGWSTAVDVTLRSPQQIGLSGSYGQSGKISEAFSDIFARRLEKRGFEVKIGEMD